MDFRKARKAKGVTQATVAVHAGISLQAYQLIERGVTKTPKPETLKKIKEILA